MVEAMRHSLSEQDAEGLQRAAHTLKGSMRYFGAEKAYQVADELEDLGRQQQLEAAVEKLNQLDEALNEVNPRLARFVESGQM